MHLRLSSYPHRTDRVLFLIHQRVLLPGPWLVQAACIFLNAARLCAGIMAAFRGWRDAAGWAIARNCQDGPVEVQTLRSLKKPRKQAKSSKQVAQDYGQAWICCWHARAVSRICLTPCFVVQPYSPFNNSLFIRSRAQRAECSKLPRAS